MPSLYVRQILSYYIIERDKIILDSLYSRHDDVFCKGLYPFCSFTVSTWFIESLWSGQIGQLDPAQLLLGSQARPAKQTRYERIS